ncbi:MAG: glycosyltransferase [Pirellulales bacterium]
MRVLALTNLYPNPYQPHRGQFNRQQLRALAEGHELRVIAPIAWTDEVALRRLNRSRLLPGRRACCDGLDVVHPRYLFTPKMLRGWYGHFFRWSVRAAFRDALARFQPELVYASWAYPDGWAAVRLARQAGLPVVIKVHGSDVLQLQSYPARRRPTVEALVEADGVVAVSRDIERHLGRLGVERGRIRVVYNGVDTERFRPGPMAEARRRLELPAEEPLVLFVGNLLPVKGLDVLLDACALLRKRQGRFHCLILGQGPLRPRLERLVRRLQLFDHVRLLGSRPHDQLPDWYRAADVVVLPSRSEGVPNVLLEAAACGVPWVASAVGGISEIARFGASALVPAGDASALAAALEQRLQDRRRGPVAVSNLRTHTQAARELCDLFLELTAGRSSQGAANRQVLHDEAARQRSPLAAESGSPW